MSYSVGRVVGHAGITVRTLHHYDEVGLLVPSERSHAGHRRYGDEDLDRLQQILFYRELGFSLEEIAVLLDDPDVDPQEHLRRQHEVLTCRIEKLRKMAAAVEQATEARRMGVNLTPEEKFEVFGDFDPDEYAEEARERWGERDAYRESKRRAASYTKEDWLRLRQEQQDWERRFAALMDSGYGPESEAAMELAQEHRQQICRFSYACTYEIHAGLAEMYLSDPRFTSTLEAIKAGMAEYLSEAIVANAIHRA